MVELVRTNLAPDFPLFHGLNSVLNVKAVVAAFNQEKALLGAFSVITNLQMDLFEAVLETRENTAGENYPSLMLPLTCQLQLF